MSDATATRRSGFVRQSPVKILFVCLGNICRSPTAEAMMRALVREQGLDGAVEVDSAGTGDWHVGQPPDRRASIAAARRGIALQGVARQVRATDFEEFDLILAMDASNASDLRQIAPDEAAALKVRLLREFEREQQREQPEHEREQREFERERREHEREQREFEREQRAACRSLDVPDPYYGGESGFEHVLDLIEAACAGVLRYLRLEDRARL